MITEHVKGMVTLRARKPMRAAQQQYPAFNVEIEARAEAGGKGRDSGKVSAELNNANRTGGDPN